MAARRSARSDADRRPSVTTAISQSPFQRRRSAVRLAAWRAWRASIGPARR